MLGAYFVFWGVVLLHLPWAVAVLGAILLTAFSGVLVDRVAYRPLREAPRISALISPIGVSFFLQNLAIVFFSAIPCQVHRPDWLAKVMIVGSVRVLPLTLFVPLLSLILMLGLIFIVYKTKPGLGMRAISKGIETSRLMGGYDQPLDFVDLRPWVDPGGGLRCFDRVSGPAAGGDYLGIATLGFAEIIRVLANNLPRVTNGALGLKGIPA